MKPLKPSLKEKKRYLLIKGKNLEENIPKAIKEFTGILGVSKTCLEFIEKSKDSIIICINRESLDLVRASLVLWPERIDVLRVSGTLKGLKGR